MNGRGLSSQKREKKGNKKSKRPSDEDILQVLLTEVTT